MYTLQDFIAAFTGVRAARAQAPRIGAPEIKKPYRVNGVAFGTLQAAFGAAKPGAVVEATGTIRGDAAILRTPNVTLRGPAILDAQGAHAEGKALIVVTVPGFVVEEIEALNFAVPDRNGAFIRFEGAGDLTLRRCHVHDGQQGLLAGNGMVGARVILDDCVFERLGDGSGQTHNIYIGRIGELRIRGGRYSDAIVGHCIKSRAARTIIDGAKIHEGRASRAIDLPDGGMVEIANCDFVQTQQTNNPDIIGYGTEGKFWPQSSFHFYASNRITNTRRPAGAIFNFKTEPDVKVIESYAFNKPLEASNQPGKEQVKPALDAKGAVLESWWASLPLNQWLEVLGTAFVSGVLPRLPTGYKDYGTAGKSPDKGLSGVFYDWSGAAFDYATGKMFVTGGGHSDSSNNGYYEFAFEKMAWRIVLQPSLYTDADVAHSKASWNAHGGWFSWSQGYDWPSYLWKDGRTTAWHSYGVIEWIPDLQKVLAAHYAGIYATDPVTAMQQRILDGPYISDSSSVYDPVGKKWYLFFLDVGKYFSYRVLDVQTMTLSPPKDAGRNTSRLLPVIVGRKIFCIQDGDTKLPAPVVFTIDLETGSIADFPLVNPPVVNQSSLSCGGYAKQTGLIYSMRRADSGPWGSFTTINPATGQCGLYMPSGNPPALQPTTTSPYGKVRIYERSNGTFIVVFNVHNANLRIVRLV